jgi:hypothetical protein
MSSRLLIWALSIVMIRLRGGGPKKRCGCFISTTERCSSPAVRKLDDTVFPFFVILLTNTAYEPVIQVLSEIAHSVTSPFAEDIDYPYAILHHWRFKLDTDLLSIIRRTTNAQIYQPAEMTHFSRTKLSWRVNKLLVERLKEYSASVLVNIPRSTLSIFIFSTSAVFR